MCTPQPGFATVSVKIRFYFLSLPFFFFIRDRRPRALCNYCETLFASLFAPLARLVKIRDLKGLKFHSIWTGVHGLYLEFCVRNKHAHGRPAHDRENNETIQLTGKFFAPRGGQFSLARPTSNCLSRF